MPTVLILFLQDAAAGAAAAAGSDTFRLALEVGNVAALAAAVKLLLPAFMAKRNGVTSLPVVSTGLTESDRAEIRHLVNSVNELVATLRAYLAAER